MIRLKYVPDGWVYINDEYINKFDGFNADCEALNLENPLVEGLFLLYTPPRKPKDRDRGIEYICPEGAHTQGDDVIHVKYQKIIEQYDNFIALKDGVTVL